MWNKFFVLLAVIVTVTGCQGNRTGGTEPKDRLRDYIAQSFSVKNIADRDRLATFLVGDAKTRLLAWSEDQFLSTFVDQKKQFVKLLIKEVEKRGEGQVAVTYELTYIDQGKSKDAKITNKKLAQMSLRDGQWYISEVQNLKELIEYKNELSLP